MRGSGRTFRQLAQAYGLMMTGYNVMWISSNKHYDTEQIHKITGIMGVPFNLQVPSKTFHHSFGGGQLKMFYHNEHDDMKQFIRGRVGIVCMIDHDIKHNHDRTFDMLCHHGIEIHDYHCRRNP